MDDIKIDRIIRSKRKTLALEVTRDAALIVRAPERTPLEYIKKIIYKKRFWIREKQKIAKEKYQKVISKEFVYLPHARDRFIDWYKKQAYLKIKERLDWYSTLLGIKYNGFNISNAQKRWGSCSAKGNLRLNWRLIMAPLQIIDYVAVYELVHLEEKNHSKSFWRKIKIIVPDYEDCKKWLRENEYLLIF